MIRSLFCTFALSVLCIHPLDAKDVTVLFEKGKSPSAFHLAGPQQQPSIYVDRNDEDWGLTPWASKSFEKERGNIGPRTYSKVCELLLHLKGNMLAPAMHPVSTPFHSIPENRMVADSFAIVLTATHCEPLLLNTAGEWNRKTMGPLLATRLWQFERQRDAGFVVHGNGLRHRRVGPAYAPHSDRRSGHGDPEDRP